MIGILFTKLIEFVEDRFGHMCNDQMIAASMLETKGAYTRGGNYSLEEFTILFEQLSIVTGISTDLLFREYGQYLFSRMIELYPFVIQHSSILDFIANINTVIHPQIKKIYPEAELPFFHVISFENCSLTIDYVSEKNLYTLAEGLMLGASQYFNQQIDVKYAFIEEKHPLIVRFIVTQIG